MGGKLYGNTPSPHVCTFSNTPWDFGSRLAEVKKVKDGPGLLVFCGNGARWHRSNLEDFADYYHAGKHRQDDPFALMEKHHIETEKPSCATWTTGCVRRPIEQAPLLDFLLACAGPSFGGVIK